MIAALSKQQTPSKTDIQKQIDTTLAKKPTSGFGMTAGLTEDQVQKRIEETLKKQASNSITEEQIQARIDAALDQ